MGGVLEVVVEGIGDGVKGVKGGCFPTSMNFVASFVGSFVRILSRAAAKSTKLAPKLTTKKD